MMSSPLPVVRLNPKSEARAIRHGFPWIYSNEVVTDRRTKAIKPGAIAHVADTNGVLMGVAAVNPTSKIFCRMLDQNPDAVIDQAWLEGVLTRALKHREMLYDAPFYRLIHAESDGLPGVIMDRFGDTIVVQPNAAWADVMFDALVNAIVAVTGVANIVKNGTGRARALEGLPEETEVVRGSVDGAVPVQMNGATYMADLLGGQKTGLFYDQRPNHAFAQRLSKNARVLDVFSHVGGFSLAALAAGAEGAIAVDGSQNALDLAVEGAKAMGKEDRYSVMKGDAFKVLEELGASGEVFDVVICDPPAFAPSKKAMEAGLRAYERVARLAAPLVAPGGYLGLCSCSHAADLTRFRNASARGIGRGGRRGQLIYTGSAGPDHPLLPQLAESGYLKSLFFRLNG
ncbi:RSP_2647 family RNA methyltransferase [Cochlodiniinecator piscidefendens]|uniref:RSP_2647 family RNA methyltransferase n=1 Tax=Cochlodiniinecator piscidefendens TaxID=2715756 RepID=UPI001408D1A4|nr:class I SAM-dependent rRNA methyltransferase [Cochlodiniinecator piscidefendens]